MTRLSKDEYLMTIAWAASMRSTCREPHGAVISQNGKVISTGYNGSLPGQEHCLDVGCQMEFVRERERCVRTIHAEDNALKTSGGRGNWMHCTGEPCFDCLRDAIQCGHIEKIVWWRKYPDQARDLLLPFAEKKIVIVRIIETPLLKELYERQKGFGSVSS